MASPILPNLLTVILMSTCLVAASWTRPFPCRRQLSPIRSLRTLVWAVGALTLFERSALLLKVVPRLSLVMKWSVRLTVDSNAVLANGPGGVDMFLARDGVLDRGREFPFRELGT